MASLDDARYFSLATFRRNGAAVETPVWFAEGADTGNYFVFSAGQAGKVKRLRVSDEARVAPCDARGRVHGDWLPARAVLLDEPDDIVAALAALRRKYGVQMLLADWLSRLSGRYHKRGYIKVTVL